MSVELDTVNKELIRELQKNISEKENIDIFEEQLKIISNQSHPPLKRRACIEIADNIIDGTFDSSLSVRNWMSDNFEDSGFMWEEVIYIALSMLILEDEFDDLEDHYDFDEEFIDFVKEGFHLSAKKIMVGSKPIDDLRRIIQNDINVESFNSVFNDVNKNDNDPEFSYLVAARHLYNEDEVISDEFSDWLEWNYSESTDSISKDEVMYIICYELVGSIYTSKNIKKHLQVSSQVLANLASNEEENNLISNEEKGESVMSKVKETAKKVTKKAKKAASKSKDETKTALVFSAKVEAGDIAIRNVKKALFVFLSAALEGTESKIEEDTLMNSPIIDVIIGQSLGYILNISEGENKAGEIMNLIGSCVIMSSTQNMIKAMNFEKYIGILTEGIDIENLRNKMDL